VLSALPSHTLAFIKAARWFYIEVDKRRWVAWDVVYRPIEEGGLGIKNLETQNICLLLKFIHKLHTSNNSSWASWIRTYIYRGNKRLGDKISVCSRSWRYLMSLTTTEYVCSIGW
jgi:hypothetical protein